MSLPWATGSQPHRSRWCKNSEAGNVFRDLDGKTLPTRAPLSWCAGAQTPVMWGTGVALGNVSKLEGDHRARWDVQVVCYPGPSPASTQPLPEAVHPQRPLMSQAHTAALPASPGLPPSQVVTRPIQTLSMSEGKILIREWHSEGHPTPATSPGCLLEMKMLSARLPQVSHS